MAIAITPAVALTMCTAAAATRRDAAVGEVGERATAGSVGHAYLPGPALSEGAVISASGETVTGDGLTARSGLRWLSEDSFSQGARTEES